MTNPLIWAARLDRSLLQRRSQLGAPLFWGVSIRVNCYDESR